MKKLMNFLLLSCQKASGLIEKKSNFSLNPIEKVQLIIHTSMCDACKGFQVQSEKIDSLLEDHIHTGPQKSNTSSDSLSADFKNQIINKLEENK